MFGLPKRNRYEDADSRLERRLRVRIATIDHRMAGIEATQREIVDGLTREISNLTARVGRLESKLREAGSVESD